MKDNVAPELLVCMAEISGVHAACIDYLPAPGQADMHEEIHACFERLQDWARTLGLDPLRLLHIGVPVVRDGQLLKYECCIEVPENIQAGPQDILVKDLPGGCYAVLSMQKDPAIIGESIGRFYQECLPENHIELDDTRPTYEIYYQSTMEYCVPVLRGAAGAGDR